jgi:hypothetical protein
MSGDDRPKKSWRELDRARESGGGGGSRRRDPLTWDREKASKTAAYAKYKSQLDKLFTPGAKVELPESMKAKMGPAPELAREKNALTKALYERADESALAAYLDAGLALPDDVRLLLRLLSVRDEARLLAVLDRLHGIVEGGQRPSRTLMVQKLDALILGLDDGPAVDRARALRELIDD